MLKLSNYKIIKFKNYNGWFVCRRRLFFFWERIHYCCFVRLDEAYNCIEQFKDWNRNPVFVEVNKKSL
jgi:hypothetical protein